MCEHCGDPSLAWDTWIQIEEPEEPEGPRQPGTEPRGEVPNCEYREPPPDDVEMTEQETIEWLEEHSCFRDATWVHRSTWPVDHLCEEHKAQKEAYYVEEHGEVPDPIGLEDADLFLQIKADEACDRIDGVEGRCGEPASWVMVGTVDVYYCDEHRSHGDVGG